MKCPHCHRPISNWKYRMKFNCPKCEKGIVSKDYTCTFAIAFVLFVFIITPISILTFGPLISIAVEGVILILILHFIIGNIVKLNKDE